MNLLETYRNAVRSFEPSADPREALERGEVVFPVPHTELAQLPARVALRPDRAFVVAGGIGTGKSTALLLVQEEVNRTPDVRAVYVDVFTLADLERFEAGTLETLAALALARTLVAKDDPVHKSLRSVAYARYELQAASPIASIAEMIANLPKFDVGLPLVEQRPQSVRRGGVLKPPSASDPSEGPLDLVSEHLPTNVRLVLLLDGLDRVSDGSGYLSMLERGLPALARRGIGVVLTVPPVVLYEHGDELARRVQGIATCPSLDMTDPAHRKFMSAVLTRRDPGHLLVQVVDGIVGASGGSLRDLLSIASATLEEAYLDGAPAARESHLQAAVRALGENLRLGLSAEAIATLQAPRHDPGDPATLKLILSRRLVDRGRGSPRFVIHPALAEVLRELQAA
jgi:hypothetical protein